MANPSEGELQARVKQYTEHRLPQMLRLKEKVDGGEQLSDSDLDFLQQTIEEARDPSQTAGFVAKYPEYEELVGKLINLYTDITARALVNEESTG